MAYKLYDFTNDPKLDEQIRLICDVLYNRREIYTGQVGGTAETSLSTFFKSKEWHSAIFRGSAGGTTSGIALVANSANCAVNVTTSAFTDTTWDTPNVYGQLSTATTLDSVARVILSAGTTATNQGFFEPVHNPYSAFGIKTPASLTGSLIFVGTAQSGFSNPNVAGKDLGAASILLRDFVGFRYDPAGGGTWNVMHRALTAAATIVSTSVTVSVSTSYLLEVYTEDGGVSWVFKINGAIVHTATTNLPAVSSTTSPGHVEFALVDNTVAGTARQLKIARIYGEYGGDLTLSS